MKIELWKHPTDEDWLLCKKAALLTVWKDTDTAPTFEWKVKMLKAMHSPIRLLNFMFYIEDLPSYISVHFVRHIHSIPFVSSQRNDRQDMYDRRKASQDVPVRMAWYMNAEELINVAHKRLCTKADPDTRKVVERLCAEVLLTNPEFMSVLVPNCIYRNHLCTEFDPCMMYKNDYDIVCNLADELEYRKE